MQLHASCASRSGQGVLLLGPSGSGKSDLLLRLLYHNFKLVADDRVYIKNGVISPPKALQGLLEVRGLGIMQLPYEISAKLALCVKLGQEIRLPFPNRQFCHVPLMTIDPHQISAVLKIDLALDCVLGRVKQLHGSLVQ